MKKNKEYGFRESAKRIFAPLKKYNKGYVYLGLISLQGGINGMIYVWTIKLITEALQSRDVAILWRIFALLLTIYLLSFVARFLRRHRGRFADLAIVNLLREKYLKAYLLLDNNYVESQGLGRMQSISSAGISARANIVGSSVSSVRSISTLIVSMVLLATTSGMAFWYIILIFIFTLINTSILTPKQTIRRRKFSENNTEQSKYVIRFLMSKTEILQNAKYDMEMSRFRDYKKKGEDIVRKMSSYGFRLWEVPWFFVDLLRFVIPLLAIYVIRGSAMTLPDIVLLLGMVWVIDGVVQAITGTYRNTIESFNDVERLWMTFDRAPRIRGYDDGKVFHFQGGDISLKHLHFNYGKWEVIRDFSLTIEGGKKTAFVWVSGSGKSTLIKLIAGYIHPQQGEVVVAGQALPNETNTDYVSLNSYYKHIGYLTQEPNVFDGSIYENLTYALDHEPTAEQLEAAIQGAQCQYIYEFPEGVQTEIGEKGIKLSGGQRQRLAIAKVMLKNPQIILLDEPTSALDSFSEEEVTKAFNNLFEGRTVIVIAHRLQTVKKADRIIVLDHGKIVEEGNHESLVKSGGVYAKMLELQSGF